MVALRASFWLLVISALVILNADEAQCAISRNTLRRILNANKNGPYVGLIIPNLFELNPLLEHPDFKPRKLIIDLSGRRFRFGTIGRKNVVLAMTGMSVINAGVTTQLMLSFFDVEGVVHYGIAGNADPSLNIGDVVIPKYWAHTSLWNWQREGEGADDPLPFEDSGMTREIGYLKFVDFTVNAKSSSADNLLNNIWYQQEEVFPVDGIPEHNQQAFWVPADNKYIKIAKKLKGLNLERCVNDTTCLSEAPRMMIVEKGVSNSFYLDNAAYRAFIYSKFNVSPVDMESAAVALICLQQRVPQIGIRALSDLAGGGKAESNEADTFSSVAATNSVRVVVEFIKLLSVSEHRDNGFTQIA